MKKRFKFFKSFFSIILLLLVLSGYQFYENGRVTWHVNVFYAIQDYSISLWHGISQDRISTISNDELVGQVARVTDGDTFTLRYSGFGEHIIRLHGIDAPEWNQPFGSASSRALSQKISGKTVTVLIEDIDSYGRLVGTVYYEGENINLNMVKEGYAWWYKYYAKSNRALKKAESDAREYEIGLWTEANPIPPWDWRRMN